MSDIRKKYAEKLVIAVTEALKDLNFLDVVFEMRFDVLSNYTANGYDDAEFMISTNPGEPVRPLGKGGIRGRTFKNYACDKNSACRSGRGGDADL